MDRIIGYEPVGPGSIPSGSTTEYVSADCNELADFFVLKSIPTRLFVYYLGNDTIHRKP